MEKEMLWKSDNGDGTFNNPILFADYSDPDVIRVGDTYYMTASSFNYTPGLPILVSKDLVNWELKNYAIKNINYESYVNPAHAKGVWAPAIRYHNNRYWISYGMPDEGIFMIYSDDPLGIWSDPILLLEGKGYIDPCPYWDDDGKAYIVHGYARSRIGFKSILGIFEMSSDGMTAISDDKFIYDGTKTQITIEGPKIYKRCGWYYVFAPAGGVKTGWQTVLRSKNINGPYDERIVMHQGNTSINGPHQGALVDMPNNEEWFVHFQDRGFYGRVVHIQPVKWIDDWPNIGINQNEKGCGEPSLTYKKPMGLLNDTPTYLEASDDFFAPELGLQWQWIGNHQQSFYSLSENKGLLRLYSLNPAGDTSPILWNCSNVLTQKFICPMFEATIKVHIKGLNNNEQTGCVILGGQYAYMAIRKENDKLRFVYVESFSDAEIIKERVVLENELEKDLQTITFRTTLYEENETMVIGMEYATQDKEFIDTGCIFEPSDHTWVGSKLGIFSVALDNGDHSGYSEIEYVKVKVVKK